MKLGVRGHDVASESAEALCQKLCRLGLHEIQLVAHKSFPDFPYGKEAVTKLAQTLNRYGIRVAIYGCYVAPLAEAGRARFLSMRKYGRQRSLLLSRLGRTNRKKLTGFCPVSFLPVIG